MGDIKRVTTGEGSKAEIKGNSRSNKNIAFDTEGCEHTGHVQFASKNISNDDDLHSSGRFVETRKEQNFIIIMCYLAWKSSEEKGIKVEIVLETYGTTEPAPPIPKMKHFLLNLSLRSIETKRGIFLRHCQMRCNQNQNAQ